MKTTASLQENWYDISHILKKYVLNTSIPLIFKDLLTDPFVFHNASFQDFLEKGSLRDTVNHPEKLPHQHLEIWEHLLKDGLIDIFVHRLLGSQTAMTAYRERSMRYSQLFNDIFGTHEQNHDLTTITQSFFEMLKDYLCRNLIDLLPHPDDLLDSQLLSACRLVYRARRYRDDRKENVHRNYYIPFEERPYSFGLLNLMDEIADHTSTHRKCQHFLVTAEFIHTLFIYVYMVEYVKLYPTRKGSPMSEMPPQIQKERKYNLFTHLTKVNYKTAYFNEVKKK